MTTILRSPGAGIFTGALAWAVYTIIAYSVAPFLCQYRAGWSIIPLALVFALFSLAGACVSYRSASDGSATDQAGGNPRHLLATLGMAVGLLFAVTIIMQAAAGVLLSGCER